jgi:hypothetical protein
VVFFVCEQIIAWLAQRQQLRGQQQAQLLKLQQQAQEQQLRGQQQEQRLLLFYRKQPRQRQRSELPKREICSCVKTLVS